MSVRIKYNRCMGVKGKDSRIFYCDLLGLLRNWFKVNKKYKQFVKIPRKVSIWYYFSSKQSFYVTVKFVNRP